MYPGIWTGIMAKSPLHKTLRLLAELGWQHFEISYEHLDMIMNSDAPERAIEMARQTIAELQVSIPQAHMHLTHDITHPDKDIREKESSWVLRHFTIAAKLGVKNVVVHPGTGEGISLRCNARKTLKNNIETFKWFCGHAGELGLRIGVENIFDRIPPPQRHFGSTPSDLLDLIDGVGSPFLGITLDTSHAQIQGLDIPATIRELGNLIICTHISDNNGTGLDQHWTPGRGVIDWKNVMSAFRDVCYDGILNLEIPGEHNPHPGIMKLKITHALAVVTAMASNKF
ncbi:MAG: hypothetical protein A2X49_14770 [Lentisphaerae bacterium GWF2_52_8]|nr:MAG: hypothetical protein A2X49_14770 [Lentisphaerae bacterium GWF2_52_8]